MIICLTNIGEVIGVLEPQDASQMKDGQVLVPKPGTPMPALAYTPDGQWFTEELQRTVESGENMNDTKFQAILERGKDRVEIFRTPTQISTRQMVINRLKRI